MTSLMAFVDLGASQTWNAATQWSATSNPNDAWSYGQRSSVTGNGFDLMASHCDCTGGPFWLLCPTCYWPSIQQSAYGTSAKGPGLWPADNSSGYPVIRWTCPTTGTYAVSSYFYGADPRGVNVLVWVVTNGSAAFSGSVQATGGTATYNTTLNLQAGTYLDYVVAWNGGTSDAYNWTAVSVNITFKATPIITWNNPAAITYGTPLSLSQLDASANVAGTFAYTPPGGTVLNVGTQTLSVVFSPTDTTDYTTATDTVSLVVLPATATVSGQVTCSCDNSSVAGVTVTIGSQSAQTDSGGNYSISGLSAGTYNVAINGPGYNFNDLPQITISSTDVLLTSNFSLKPNATDITALNNIAPASSVTTSPNGTVMNATFTPGIAGLTVQQAACRLGFNHFNWYQQASSQSYQNIVNCSANPFAWFVDPPAYYCANAPAIYFVNNPDGRYEVQVTRNPATYEFADSLPFYYNENTGGKFDYTDSSHYNATQTQFYFYDHPDVQSWDTASFVASLVGVKDDGTYQFIQTFAWQSYDWDIFNGITVISASLLSATNGSGGITNIQTELIPANISPGALALMIQTGGNFPLSIQPSSQTVECAAKVTFAISPTNSSSPINYQWRINGTNISSATNLTLQLLGVTTNSTGIYDAILSNSNGRIGTAVATLAVLSAPLFQSPIITTNCLVLSWASAQGKIYQLQYKTNLTQTNWMNRGSTIIASNVVVSATNSFGSDNQRFYRVQQQ